MDAAAFIPFEQTDLTDGFWRDRYELNKRVSIENVRRRFEESGRFDALRFNFLKTGRRPHIFFDSDVAKWMEAVAYLAEKDPDGMREHLALCEELIGYMEAAQRPDGYLNSTHQQLMPENIFRVRGNHELYCAGHLIEAAIAYHKANGKDRFLKIMERYCECIRRAFITEKTAAFTTPGHEEIELALVALYRHTGKTVYLDMARFFLSERGLSGGGDVYAGNYLGTQDDTDIRHLHDANGHCVRALYYYCGIADLAAETGDDLLLGNLCDVFTDISRRKMYLTGAVGSTHRTESFTVPFDLPNRTAYAESCASIALVLFAARMRQIDRSARYGDVAERVLYNALLSSVSLDGKSFFYENPLEIALCEYGREVAVPEGSREHLPIPERVELFNCSCCPPNINRFFGKFGSFLALTEDGHVTLEQYVSADFRTPFGHVRVREAYATAGTVTAESDDYASDTLAFRIPAWSGKYTVVLNGQAVTPAVRDGYAYVSVPSAFRLELDFGIAPVFVSADPRVRADAGRVALTYGPVVLCMEGTDNGPDLWQMSVDPADISRAEVSRDPLSGLCAVRMPAYRDCAPEDGGTDGLYRPADRISERRVTASFIPYFAFANRGKSDMAVWIRRHGV
jgi:uncharacterized protein